MLRTESALRWSAFSDAEMEALAAALWAASGEGAFDQDSDLWLEVLAECERRGLKIG